MIHNYYTGKYDTSFLFKYSYSVFCGQITQGVSSFHIQTFRAS